MRVAKTILSLFTACELAVFGLLSTANLCPAGHEVIEIVQFISVYCGQYFKSPYLSFFCSRCKFNFIDSLTSLHPFLKVGCLPCTCQQRNEVCIVYPLFIPNFPVVIASLKQSVFILFPEKHVEPRQFVQTTILCDKYSVCSQCGRF